MRRFSILFVGLVLVGAGCGSKIAEYKSGKVAEKGVPQTAVMAGKERGTSSPSCEVYAVGNYAFCLASGWKIKEGAREKIIFVKDKGEISYTQNTEGPSGPITVRNTGEISVTVATTETPVRDYILTGFARSVPPNNPVVRADNREAHEYAADAGIFGGRGYGVRFGKDIVAIELNMSGEDAEDFERGFQSIVDSVSEAQAWKEPAVVFPKIPEWEALGPYPLAPAVELGPLDVRKGGVARSHQYKGFVSMARVEYNVVPLIADIRTVAEFAQRHNDFGLYQNDYYNGGPITKQDISFLGQEALRYTYGGAEGDGHDTYLFIKGRYAIVIDAWQRLHAESPYREIFPRQVAQILAQLEIK